MNALFHRRIYKHFGLLRDRLVTSQHYSSVRTLKTVSRVCDATSHRPSSVLSHSTCLIYCRTCRRLSDDAHSHTDRFGKAADGRWSNRCSCCGLNSKGSVNCCLWNFKCECFSGRQRLTNNTKSYTPSREYNFKAV